MANPPITIGPFDNVPAPGSPIGSPWAQQLTQYAVDGRSNVLRVTYAGGSHPGGAAVTLMQIQTPVVPVGKIAVMMSTIGYQQWNNPSSFDINYISPNGTHNFGAVSTNQNLIHTYQTTVLGAGATMLFQVSLNPWGGQGIIVSAVSSMVVMLLSL